MFRVYIKLPDGSMQDRLVTASMRDAEAHYSELCKRRTPGLRWPSTIRLCRSWASGASVSTWTIPTDSAGSSGP